MGRDRRLISPRVELVESEKHPYRRRIRVYRRVEVLAAVVLCAFMFLFHTQTRSVCLLVNVVDIEKRDRTKFEII